MRRRALIVGAAAALAAPTIARARTWDSFGDTFTRLHRGVWLPATDSELNPAGQLVGGLKMLLMFDAGSLRAGNVRSKVLAGGPVFTFTGTSQVLTTAPTGGMAISSSGNSTDDLNTSGGLLQLPSWTVSALIKFDGTGGGSGDECLTANATSPIQYIASGGANLAFADSAGNVATGITMASLSGWTRMTMTATNASPTVNRTYLNGKLSDTSNSLGNNTTMDFFSFINGWSFPTADLFIWNRTLNADQVAAHAADPYGTVMRARLSPLGVKGTIASGKKPSILTLGVGP